MSTVERTEQEVTKMLSHLYHSAWNYFSPPSYAGLPGFMHYGLSDEFIRVIESNFDKRSTMNYISWDLQVMNELVEANAPEVMQWWPSQ